MKLPLPIGISFYVFQSVSYGIDVYRGKYPAERNIISLALYISFFPQLIAGPIVRFETVSRNLKSRTHSFEKLSDGFFRFSVGVGKKVLIADRLYAFCEAAHVTGSPSVALAWAESLAFLLYVYFDFSGYSDMAIGLAKCFGFELPENFNYPLMSTSFGEFWRRWHISLGTWFRDYLYIPLGGSRAGKGKHIRNLLIVWALTGLWHGASWNYVLWGLSFGLAIVIEALTGFKRGTGTEKGTNAEKAVSAEKPGNADKAAAAEKAGRTVIVRQLLKRLFITCITVIIFVWFRFPVLNDAFGQFAKMFGAAPLWSADSGYLLGGAFILLLIALTGATPLIKTLAGRFAGYEKTSGLVPILKTAVMLAILVFATAYLVDGSFSPFLYFRF